MSKDRKKIKCFIHSSIYFKIFILTNTHKLITFHLSLSVVYVTVKFYNNK